MNPQRRAGMTGIRLLGVVAAIALFCAGCRSTPDAKATAKPGETANLNAAMGKGDEATAKADIAADAAMARMQLMVARLLADINAAREANGGNPAGIPQQQTDAHLEVAQSRLVGTVEDAEARAAAAVRDKLLEQGKAAEARAATDKAIAEARANAGEIAVAIADAKAAREESKVARAAEKQALTDLATKLEQNRKDNQAAIAAAIQKAKDEERKAFLRRLGFVLLALGVIGALVAGATMYLTKGREWERAAIAAGGGVAAFSLYWCMGQSWWPYLMWACGGGMVGAVAWYLWRESRQHKAIQEKVVRSAEADEAEDTLKRIITVVDELGDTATVATVRAEIGRRSNDNNKALIHELRAESKRKAA